jgi:hypothetical protein
MIESRELERVKGNRTLVFSLEVSGISQCFQVPFRHFAAFWAIEITTEFLFVGMAVARPMRVLFNPFDGGYPRCPRCVSIEIDLCGPL